MVSFALGSIYIVLTSLVITYTVLPNGAGIEQTLPHVKGEYWNKFAFPFNFFFIHFCQSDVLF